MKIDINANKSAMGIIGIVCTTIGTCYTVSALCRSEIKLRKLEREFEMEDRVVKAEKCANILNESSVNATK